MNNFKDTALDQNIQRYFDVRKTMDRSEHLEMMKFVAELLEDGEDRKDIIMYLEHYIHQWDDTFDRMFKRWERYSEAVKLCKQYQ